MRSFALCELALVVSVSIFGCHRHHQANAKEPPTGSNPPPASNEMSDGHPTSGAAPTAQGGTCSGSCAHYLQCKGINSPMASSQCIAKCVQMNVTPAQLAQFEALDCATAISLIERPSTTGPSNDADCNGCVWDGSACMWYSTGNWGAGPYSGAASGCDAKCCPGH